MEARSEKNIMLRSGNFSCNEAGFTIICRDDIRGDTRGAGVGEDRRQSRKDRLISQVGMRIDHISIVAIPIARKKTFLYNVERIEQTLL